MPMDSMPNTTVTIWLVQLQYSNSMFQDEVDSEKIAKKT